MHYFCNLENHIFSGLKSNCFNDQNVKYAVKHTMQWRVPGRWDWKHTIWEICHEKQKLDEVE